MLADISYGDNVGAAIMYNERKCKTDPPSAYFLSSRGFLPAMRNPIVYISTFENFLVNTKQQDPVFHASVTLPPHEQLNDDQWRHVAERYMNRMGFDGTPYVAYRHIDTKHSHIHIVSAMLTGDGGYLNRYNFFFKSERVCAELASELGLSQIISKKEKGKGLEDFIDRPEIKQDSTQGIRSEIARRLRHIKDNYKFTSKAEFSHILAVYGIDLEERTFIDRKGEQRTGWIYTLAGENHKPIPASKIYHGVTEDVILRKADGNKRTKDKLIEKSRGRVGAAINTFFTENSSSLSLTAFKSHLYQQGVIAIPQANSGGIFGITFVDDQTGIIMKGSEVGREYSLKNLTERGLSTTISTTESQTFDSSQETPFRYDAGQPGRQAVPMVHSSLSNEVIKAAYEKLITDYKPIWERRSIVVEKILTGALLQDYVSKLPSENYQQLPTADDCEKFVSHQKGRILEIKANEAFNRLFLPLYLPVLKSAVLNSNLNFLSLRQQIDVESVLKNVFSSQEYRQLMLNPEYGFLINEERLRGLANNILKNSIESFTKAPIEFYINAVIDGCWEKQLFSEAPPFNNDEVLTMFLDQDLVALTYIQLNERGVDEKSFPKDEVRTAIEKWITEKRESLPRMISDRMIRESFDKYISEYRTQQGIPTREADFLTHQYATEAHMKIISDSLANVEKFQDEKFVSLIHQRLEDFALHKRTQIPSIYLKDLLKEYKADFYGELKRQNSITKEVACRDHLTIAGAMEAIKRKIETENSAVLKYSTPEEIASTLTVSVSRFVQTEKRNAPVYAVLDLLQQNNFATFKQICNERNLPERTVIDLVLTTESFHDKTIGSNEFQTALAGIFERYPAADQKFIERLIKDNASQFVSYLKSDYRVFEGEKFVYKERSLPSTADVITQSASIFEDRGDVGQSLKKKKKRKGNHL